MKTSVKKKSKYFKYDGHNITIEGFGNRPGKETPPPATEHIKACKQFIWKWVDKRKSLNYKHSSYLLKHLVEELYAHETGMSDLYVSNGAFIQAAIELGYTAKRITGSFSAIFNMSYVRLERHIRENKIANRII